MTISVFEWYHNIGWPWAWNLCLRILNITVWRTLEAGISRRRWEWECDYDWNCDLSEISLVLLPFTIHEIIDVPLHLCMADVVWTDLPRNGGLFFSSTFLFIKSRYPLPSSESWICQNRVVVYIKAQARSTDTWSNQAFRTRITLSACSVLQISPSMESH